MAATLKFLIKEGKHAALGASNSQLWLNCAAMLNATAGVANSHSFASAEGTAAHRLAEWCLNQKKDAKEFLGQEFQVGEFTIVADEEMVDGVNAYLKYVKALPGKKFYEQELSYSTWVTDGFGTADLVSISDYKCHVADFKYGKGVQVFADDHNSQLKLYALGVYSKFTSLMRYKFKKFILHICQPRLEHFDSFEIDIEDLLKWAVEVVKPASKATQAKDAPFKPGFWCQNYFCKIRDTCKARAEYMLVSPIDEFDNLDAFTGKEVTTVPHWILDNDQVARILTVKSLVVSWYQELEKYALRELAHGRPVGDWKIVEGRSNRQWKGSEEDIAITLSLEGLEEDQIYPKELITPPAAEKLLGKSKHIIGTGDSPNDMVRKPPGAPTLVPGDDKRPPMTLKPELEFDNLDSPEE